LGFSWNSQGQVSQLQVNDNGTLSSYAFNYNTRGKLASYSKTVGGITTEQWYLFHGPQGLEKAQRLQYGMLNLTLDFTTDPRGRILSMTHTPSGGAQGFTGEVYFHYDNAGNTSLLTNASGAPLASFQHDALSGMLLNAWNPQNITFPWIGGGSAGGITIKPFPGKDLWISYDAYLKWLAMQEALKTAWEKIGKASSSSSINGCCDDKMCWCNPCEGPCETALREIRWNKLYVDYWESQKELFDQSGYFWKHPRYDAKSGKMAPWGLPEDKLTRKHFERFSDTVDCFFAWYFGLGTVDYQECLKDKSTKRAHDYINGEIADYQKTIDYYCGDWEWYDCDKWAEETQNYWEDVIREIAAICNKKY